MDPPEHTLTRPEEVFDLEQRPVTASELPEPETTKEWQDLPRYPPAIAVPKGYFGAMVRAAMGVPKCVWVINQHTEDITVVVSTHRPMRLLTGGGIDLSATGGGLNFSATAFLRPATRKTLAPQHLGRERSLAVFPVSTRKDGFAVISIFTGPDKTLYIENDRVPLGATAYFVNRPNLTIKNYKRNNAERDRV